MSVYAKLINIQSKLKAPKSQYNSFGKYNYRNCEDILEALKPHLAEEKATVILSDEVILVAERFYIQATAAIIDVETGEKVEVKALAREDENKKGMDLAQVTGSVSSYARKYALNGLFCIDDTKDSDTTNTHDKGTSKANGGLSEAMVKRLYAIGNKAKQTPAAILTVCMKEFKVKKVEEMTKEQYDSICERLEKSIK